MMCGCCHHQASFGNIGQGNIRTLGTLALLSPDAFKNALQPGSTAPREAQRKPMSSSNVAEAMNPNGRQIQQDEDLRQRNGEINGIVDEEVQQNLNQRNGESNGIVDEEVQQNLNQRNGEEDEEESTPVCTVPQQLPAGYEKNSN